MAGGGGALIKNRGRGGLSEEEAQEGEGRRGNVCGQGGGGDTFFFRGRNVHQEGVVTDRGLFAVACQHIVSPRGRTSYHTVTQMRHPPLVEGRPNCARRSLASTLSAPRVAARSYCDPGRHGKSFVTPCLLTPFLNVPKNFCHGKS